MVRLMLMLVAVLVACPSTSQPTPDELVQPFAHAIPAQATPTPTPTPTPNAPIIPPRPSRTRCTETNTCRVLADGFESITIGSELEGDEQHTIWNTRVRCRRRPNRIGAVSVNCYHQNVEGFEDLDMYVQYLRDEYGPEDSAVIATNQARYTWRQGVYQLTVQEHFDLRTYYTRMPGFGSP